MGDLENALRFAREAKETRARVLGPYHPKVKEIDQMIREADGQ